MPTERPWLVLVSIFAVLASSACRDPARQCEAQTDCFGSELCVGGSCVLQVADEDAGEELDVTVIHIEDVRRDTDDGASDDDTGVVDATTNDTTVAPDASCTPDCGNVECGEEPVCGKSCGECAPTETCEEGTCVEAPVFTEWTLDGMVVHQSTTAEAYYSAANDTMFVGTPLNGRNIQLNFTEVSTTQSVTYSCADEPGVVISPLSLITSDNGFAELDRLPDRWKGLILNGGHCANEPPDDQLAEWALDVTMLSTARIVGSVSIEIAGGGPRAGETLAIQSEFDVEATSM